MTSAPEAHKTAGVLIDRDRLAFIIASNLDCTAEVASITGIGEAADEILAEIEDALLFSTPSVPAVAELSGGLPLGVAGAAARVINDNQPGSTAVVEVLTKPATLGVGTLLYAHSAAAPVNEDMLRAARNTLPSPLDTEICDADLEDIWEAMNAALSASPAGDGLKAGLPQSAASGAERELRAALERIVNPIGFMKKQADATGFKLDGHMAMTLSNDANYLKGIAQKALDALPASGDGPDAGHAAARSSSTEAVEQERPTGHFAIDHDGFAGTVIGHYTTLEGKQGVVLQQDGTRVVHVYGEKWLKPSPVPAACKPEGETHG